MPLQTRKTPAARGEKEVVAQRHVRKQSAPQRKVPARPGYRGQIDARGAIEEKLAVDQNAALVRLDQTCDRFEQDRLARPRRAEHSRDSLGSHKLGFQGEPGLAGPGSAGLANARLDHRAACLGLRRFETNSSARTTADMTSTSARAVAPSPLSTASKTATDSVWVRFGRLPAIRIVMPKSAMDRAISQRRGGQDGGLAPRAGSPARTRASGKRRDRAPRARSWGLLLRELSART